MIGIGISENVFISGASITEKGFLEISFDEVGANRPKTAFDMLNQDTIVDVPPNTNLYLFPPTPPKNDDPDPNKRLTQEKMVDRVTKDTKANKEILIHLLMGFLTAEESKLDQFRSIDITAENFNTKILNIEVLKSIFNNIATDFITKIKPFVGDQTKPFRLLLVRQNKDKHFAGFRKNYINENPFWEPMEVSKEASKLKFSDYEIREGLTDATPIERNTADNKKTGTPGTSSAPSGPALTASSVFGG